MSPHVSDDGDTDALEVSFGEGSPLESREIAEHVCVEMASVQAQVLIGRSSLSEHLSHAPRQDPLEHATSIVSMAPNCFSLTLWSASQGKSLAFPMLLVLPITAVQLAALYVIIFRYPEYLFGQGRWILPVDPQQGLAMFGMKAFGLLLSNMQMIEEFSDIGDGYQVLCQSNINDPSTKFAHRVICWTVITMQYWIALMVMVVASHLVLSRSKPIDTLWITYYVFMTLNFDNMLVRFTYIVKTMQRPQNFEIPLAAPLTEADRQIRQSSLGLPAACCGVSASWSEEHVTSKAPVEASVPLLSGYASEDLAYPPMVYWIVVPVQQDEPTSLQVREGLASDGSPAQLAGHVAAQPVQLFSWLVEHGYKTADIEGIFAELESSSGSVVLYNQMFPYAAHFSVPYFPQISRARIYAMVENANTGALSPSVVSSQILAKIRCPEHCVRCNNHGVCRQCSLGYTLTETLACESCAKGCGRCNTPGTCDAGGCMAGFGSYGNECLPCKSAACDSCDVEAERVDLDQTPSELNCTQCISGYGKDDNGTCLACAIDNCLECTNARTCILCDEGFTPVQDGNGTTYCGACAERCKSCNANGAGLCDPFQCISGYAIANDRCEPCGQNCVACDSNGPGKCDPGGCRSGHGLQGSQEQLSWWGHASGASCRRCKLANCKVCDTSSFTCDLCEAHYGLTPERDCALCGAFCAKCDLAGQCQECKLGYVLREGSCKPCGDKCDRCDVHGPATCDEGNCTRSWTSVMEGTYFVCRPCSDPECPSCDLKGPGTCDLELNASSFVRFA
eukprot:TRINITY_DN15367_c0_g1_i3.p1 TRINITY_DN15367_c0_g1~~TRINITY_DN15367_c0_g1_i3.p1  ORF type:complete len:791 (+),score=66.80 TRINITY_DN15367_c0_g1_i3:39-2411(+)